MLSKQESNIDLIFTRGRHSQIDLYYSSDSYLHLPKVTIRKNSTISISFKHTLRDIILLFHDIAGLHMNLEEWKQLCRKVWENDYEFLQMDRFAKIGEGRDTIRNCNKNTCIECIPETKPFHFPYINMINLLKNKDELKDLDEVAYLQSKAKQIRLGEKLGKHGFHFDIKELFEPITKAVTDSNQKLLEESKSTTKAIENLDELNKYLKTLELLNKIETVYSGLIRPLSKLLVLKNKSQFRLVDDLDSDKWIDFLLH